MPMKAMRCGRKRELMTGVGVIVVCQIRRACRALNIGTYTSLLLPSPDRTALEI